MKNVLKLLDALKDKMAKSRSAKGSAMVMTVAVIMVIAVLGIIALFASSANIAMSSRVQTWTKEYYSMDKNLRLKVDMLDEKLAEAEKLAQKYLSLGICEYQSDFMPESLSGDLYDDDDKVAYLRIKSLISQNAQNFFNMRWNNEVDAHYDQFDSELYNQKLQEYLEEAFERLYYYFACKIINDELQTGIFKDSSDNGTAYKYKFDENASPLGKKYIDIDFETNDVFWDHYDFKGSEPFIFMIAAEYGDKTLKTDISIHKPKYTLVPKTKNVPFEGNPLWTYALFARNNIRFFSSVQGGAGESTGAIICGDIFSADYSEYSHAKGTHIIEEGNINGISVEHTGVDVYGNVYCRGDVHITKSSESRKALLNVLAYDDFLKVHDTSSTERIKRDLKYNMYGGNKFFADYRLFEQYTDAVRQMAKKCSSWYQGNDGEDYAKIIPSDYEGGNVYCNNLSIEENASNAKIEVAGNVWTYDDIQIDGDASIIAVNGIYAGLRSTSAEKDPNASSCVINNKPESSKIYLRNDFIIPGTAFVKLDENGYYQTVESAGARASETFSAYIDEQTFNEDKFVFENHMIDGMELRLIKFDSERSQETLFAETIFSRIINYFKNAGMHPDAAGIIFDNSSPSPTGKKMYVLGSAIGSKEGNLKVFSKYETDVKYSANQMAYNTIKDVLENVFKSKTTRMGTRNGEIDSFYNKSAINNMSGEAKIKRIIIRNSPPTYRKVSEIYEGQHQDNLVFLYFEGNDSSSRLTLEVDRDFYGIIFSMNDIEIKGDKKIRGSVISMGDILCDCSNSIDILYDEDVIKNILKKDRYVYDFFRLPKAYALPAPAFYAIREEVSENAIARDNAWKKTKRISIKSWIHK